MSHAQTYEEASAAYEAGQYAKAFASLKFYAETGDPLAQLTLGNMYKSGLSVARDVGEAVRWYRKAAVQGVPDAQFSLAILHLKGYGLTEGDIDGMTWLKQAAERGHRQARLAYDYLHREGYYSSR